MYLDLNLRILSKNRNESRKMTNSDSKCHHFWKTRGWFYLLYFIISLLFSLKYIDILDLQFSDPNPRSSLDPTNDYTLVGNSD